MEGVLNTAFSLISALLAVSVLGASLWRGCARRYLFINLSVAAMLLGDALRYAVLYKYGMKSPEYFFTFFGTDALLVTITYLLLLSFFEVIFGQSPMRKQVRWGLLFFMVLIGLMSYAMISRSVTSAHFYSRLIIEFQQNMYFAAVLLTVLLWIALKHLRVHDPRLVLLIAGVGISLSAQAANWAFGNILSKEAWEALSPVIRRVPVLATMTKLGLWCYALSTTFEYAADSEPALAEAEAKGTA